MKYLDNVINDNLLQNQIINGDMAVYQRKSPAGNTLISVSTSAYTLDRFKVTNNSISATLTVTQSPLMDTERLLVGAEKLYWLNIASTSIDAKTEQHIENLRQFCGKQLVCTMWVIGSVGDTITPTITANFGSGGSAQETVVVSDTNNLVITTTGVPQKIYFTFMVPAYLGNTFGIDNTSYLSVGINHVSSGAACKYTGWQVNIGAGIVPFTLHTRSPFEERIMCEKYYEKSHPSKATSKIEGLIISNNLADVTNDINISVGVCFDSTRLARIELSSALVKKLDATWSVGDTGGLLQAGQTKTSSESYRLYLISADDGLNPDVIATKYNIPLVLPVGYTLFRYIGSIRTISTGAIQRFEHLGNEFIIYTDTYLINGSVGAGTWLQGVTNIPLGLTRPIIKCLLAQASTGSASMTVYHVLPDGASAFAFVIASGAYGDNQISGDIVLSAAYTFQIVVVTTGTRIMHVLGYIDRDREAC